MKTKYRDRMVCWQEFLGRPIKVVNSSDKSKIGIEGIVFDETQKMFFVKTSKGIKKIPKKECIFDIYIDKWYRIEGEKINIRPEDRIRLIKKRC